MGKSVGPANDNIGKPKINDPSDMMMDFLATAHGEQVYDERLDLEALILINGLVINGDAQYTIVNFEELRTFIGGLCEGMLDAAKQTVVNYIVPQIWDCPVGVLTIRNDDSGRSIIYDGYTEAPDPITLN